MAIGTYAELQTAVANWLDRDDLTDRIPEFIALAEAKMNRVLRISLMENVSTALLMSGGVRDYSPCHGVYGDEGVSPNDFSRNSLVLHNSRNDE